MAPITNGKVIFNSIPKGYPEPGKTLIYDQSNAIDLETVELDGGALLKSLAISVDPYLRGQMREPHVSSYAPAFTLGEPLISLVVVVILRSDDVDAKVGDHFVGFLPHQHYTIIKDISSLRKIDNKYGLPWTYSIGILGITGQTAYHGWMEFSHAKAGETVYVTTAGGPVGSVVVQLAKSQGLKVIASAGSDEKVAFAKECGADVAFNYKNQPTSEVLEMHGPIDIFWDNVGGSQFAAALEAAATRARFIECGAIEGYNGEAYPVKNLHHIFAKGLILNGFIVSRDLCAKWDEIFFRDFSERVANGEFKVKEDIFNGLECVEEAILAVQTGTNKGKAIVVLADQ